MRTLTTDTENTSVVEEPQSAVKYYPKTEKKNKQENLP